MDKQRIMEFARRVVGKKKNDIESVSLVGEQIEQFAKMVWDEAYQKGSNDGYEYAILKERG